MERAILLIDDDQNVLHGLARALRHQPYQIYTATSGEEAMLIIKSHRIDVAVADERMPGMQGGQLLAWMAAHCPEVVRIVLTGHPTIDAAIRAINEGRVYQFFTKPCDALQLGVAIRKALEHKEAVERNQRLIEGNRRQAEQLELCRGDLLTLSGIIAGKPDAPPQTLSHASDAPPEEEPCLAAALRAKELVNRVLDGLAKIECILNELIHVGRCEG